MLMACLSEVYWEEARKTACYMYNRSPSTFDASFTASTFEMYFGAVASVSHLKIFGSTCYPVNLTRAKGNHEPKAWPGIFVGYQDQQLAGWRIYLPRSNEFIITAHASFVDHRLGSEL